MFSRRLPAVQVIPRLWMGSSPAARSTRRLAREGINCVIDLRAERATPDRWPDGVVVHHLPFQDHGAPSVQRLREAAAVVSGLVREGAAVLVHCHAGVERTPTVVCATLLMMGWPIDAAYARVLECRPDAAPTDGQLKALRGMANELGALSPRSASAAP